MKWKIYITEILIIICLFLIIPIFVSNATSSYTLYSGNFNLILNQNDSMGLQLLNYYVAIKYLNATSINTTANINGKFTNEIYSSTLKFTSNTDGKMRILTNLNQTENHIIKVKVNREETLMANQSVFSFLNGDNITIYFEVSNPMITKTHINAILGIIGIGLFCANPILSYILSNKAKDKFHFFFLLMGIGIISVGLAFAFIYG